MPDPIDVAALDRLTEEIERLQGEGPQAIASKYLALIIASPRATLAANKSAEKYARVLVVLTVVLIVLTIVIAGLTGVLALRAH